MRTVLVALALLAAPALAFGPRCRPVALGEAETELVNTQLAPPRDFKVAFIGDQGINSESVRVLQMIKNEGARAVVHSGDYDYENNPDAWMDQLESVLGDDYPYFASIGNHDNLRWNEYARLLSDHMGRVSNVSCTGEMGVQMTCAYQGLLVILSGVGTRPGAVAHDQYITQEFSRQNNIWKVVSWHKNHRNYQIGGKITEVGLENYDAALEQGAIVATGHEHSYARSHTMSSFSEYKVVDENNTLQVEPGKSFVFCSGLGGQGIRDWDDDLVDNPWWAAVGASDNGVSDGALFCTFNIDNNPRLAECYFKDLNNREFDRFRVVSNNAGSVRAPTERARAREMHEIAVMSETDDYSVDAAGAVVHGEQMAWGKGFTSYVTFRTFTAARALLQRLRAVRLQVYGASEGASAELPSFEIRASLGEGRVTKTAVVWDKEDDGFEGESVWVSPDLTPLLQELLDNTSQQMVKGLTLVITGKGARRVWATEQDDCFAPTLSLHLAKTPVSR